MPATSSLSYVGGVADPEYVYYNASVTNSKSDEEAPIVFQDTRQTPILRDSSQYILSVENFTINGATKALPILIPELSHPDAPISSINWNRTIYSVTYTWSGDVIGQPAGGYIFQHTEHIYWDAEDVSVSPPPPSANQQQSDYYYCYSPRHWLNLMNVALTNAWKEVNKQAYNLFVVPGTPTFAQYVLATYPPYFSYNTDTQTFSISQDLNTSITKYGVVGGGPADGPPFFASGQAANGFNAQPYCPNEFSFVGLNNSLEALVSYLPAKYYGSGTPITGFAFGGPYNYPANVIVPSITLLNPMGTIYDSVTGYDNVCSSGNYGVLINPYTTTFDANQSQAVYVRMTEYKSTLDTIWSPVQSFVLLTQFVPVINEFVSDAVPVGDGNNGVTQGTGGNFNRVLIEVPEADLVTNTKLLVYRPVTSTFTSLAPSHKSLNVIDFQMFWRNRFTGSLIPLTLISRGSASIRLLFKKVTSAF
jgi:hypothetical protein